MFIVADANPNTIFGLSISSFILLVGIGCLIVAIIGGNITIINFKTPPLTSVSQRTALGILGALLIGGALYSLRPQPAPKDIAAAPVTGSCSVDGIGQGFTDGCTYNGETIKVFRIRNDHELGIYVRNVGSRPVKFSVKASCNSRNCNEWHTWILKPSPDNSSDNDESVTITQSEDPQRLDWRVQLAS